MFKLLSAIEQNKPNTLQNSKVDRRWKRMHTTYLIRSCQWCTSSSSSLRVWMKPGADGAVHLWSSTWKSDHTNLDTRDWSHSSAAAGASHWMDWEGTIATPVDNRGNLEIRREGNWFFSEKADEFFFVFWLRNLIWNATLIVFSNDLSMLISNFIFNIQKVDSYFIQWYNSLYCSRKRKFCL